MKERPIIFSAPMVNAILEGRKTMTRRAVKPPHWAMPSDIYLFNGLPLVEDDDGADYFINCPYGQPGDRLWVRETFALQHCVEWESPPFEDGRPVKWREISDIEGFSPVWVQPHYRATDPAPDLCCEREGCRQCANNDYGPHWKPSIHMPRWASRITLEVTGVRVERLNDISARGASNDCTAEGVFHCGLRVPKYEEWNGAGFRSSEKYMYSLLWESINGPGSWESNPWVWVIEFKRL